MTRDDLLTMLTEQTAACALAREALLSESRFVVWDCLIPANRHAHTYRTRLRRMRQRKPEHAIPGLAETVDILERADDELLRLGQINTPDGAWTFMLFLNTAATAVLACAGIAAIPRETD
ncbi:hypothetical protein [Embleya scabrispora]|uniref:hypothetical protein n=1 Tax=Embleya scabrispora TaxID=159449 RepID=UPI000381EB52|nr:hypothetical protein [Embleya scabrispora]MYS84083.1 hypothetical protein [Streptomyces sp. SID5474]